MNKTVFALAALALVGACSLHRSDPHRTDDPQFARTFIQTATIAAVAKPGALVCREMQVGIAEQDWVRGVVLEADGRRVRVRIDTPGRFEHMLAGLTVVQGATFWDEAIEWTPCR